MEGPFFSSPSCVQQETDEKTACANHVDEGFQNLIKICTLTSEFR